MVNINIFLLIAIYVGVEKVVANLLQEMRTALWKWWPMYMHQVQDPDLAED